QLRATVSQFGVTSELVKQKLDYVWNTFILLPNDSRNILLKLHLHPTSHSRKPRLGPAVTTTLMTEHPQKIQTGVQGPIMICGKPVGALLLGRSSATVLGLFVLPGVIDADYKGEICMMVHTPFPPLKINKGQRIAQLIPLPQMTQSIPPIQPGPRGKQGFGSTGGLTLLTLDLSTRPKHDVELEYNNKKRVLEGLLDTGADSSIVSPNHWPHHWPMLPSMVTVTGVGGPTLAKKS
ncbi:POK9 protein, partial [Calyptomena viridis]|nr:POK9 protein [Calyptomena viridis]